MKSNNGLTTYKCHMSFINKRILTLLLFFLLLVLVSCIYLLIAYWVKMPIMLKLFGIIIIPIAILGVFMTPLNGMFVTNKYVIFIPDIRIKRVTIEKLKKISFILNERENGKFSVIVKIICIDGKTFVKDYSSQFANVRKKKFIMQAYTINKCKVEKLIEKISCLQFAQVTIVGKNGEIVYQKV